MTPTEMIAQAESLEALADEIVRRSNVLAYREQAQKLREEAFHLLAEGKGEA